MLRSGHPLRDGSHERPLEAEARRGRGAAARIATRGRSPTGCVHTRVRPNRRLRVVQPPAHGACYPCRAL